MAPVPDLPPAGLRLLLRPALLLAGLALAGAALRLAPGLDPAGLARLAGTGAGGTFRFVAGAAALTAVGVPRQAVAFAGGWLHGVWGGFGLAMLGQALGCVADFAWARLAARDWARRRVLRGRLARLDAWLAANPFTATLMLRLLPVGNNTALSLLGGVSGVPAARFLTATAIGYVPQTAVFALLGSGVRVAQALRIGLAIGLFALSGACGLVLLRRSRAGEGISSGAAGSPAATPPG